jgi:hypothetical protein
MIMSLIYLGCLHAHIMGVYCMKAMCRIGFRLKYLLIYVEHIALVFIQFAYMHLERFRDVFISIIFHYKHKMLSSCTFDL